MKNINVTAGLKARSFSGLNKITTNGNSVTWVPQEEAGQYVKTETLRVTKNGTYTPPQGVYYDRVIVKVRKKDRKAVSGDTPETVTPEATKVSVNVSKVRTGMTFPNVEKITTPGTNGETVTWVQENQAYVYAKTESLNATENDTYDPSEGAFFKQVTVNVTGEQEDDLDDDGTGTGGTGGTGEIVKAYSSVTVNVPDGTIEKVITQNGNYDPQDDEVVGYNKLIVDVHVGKTIDVTITPEVIDKLIESIKDKDDFAIFYPSFFDSDAVGFSSVKSLIYLIHKRIIKYGMSFPDFGNEILRYDDLR